jgi:hypothetical protein
MHRCPKREEFGGDEKVWLKIRTEDGNEAFVHKIDLLTPERLEERKNLVTAQSRLRQYFDRAKKASGSLSGFAGMYSLSSCPDQTLINRSIAMFALSLLWSEQNRLYKANVKSPDVLVEYVVAPDSRVTFSKTAPEPFNSVGSVQLYKMTAVNPKFSTEYFGFGPDVIFYRTDGNSYKVMRRCGTAASEEHEIIDHYYPIAIESFPRRP